MSTGMVGFFILMFAVFLFLEVFYIRRKLQLQETRIHLNINNVHTNMSKLMGTLPTGNMGARLEEIQAQVNLLCEKFVGLEAVIENLHKIPGMESQLTDVLSMEKVQGEKLLKEVQAVGSALMNIEEVAQRPTVAPEAVQGMETRMEALERSLEKATAKKATVEPEEIQPLIEKVMEERFNQMDTCITRLEELWTVFQRVDQKVREFDGKITEIERALTAN